MAPINKQVFVVHGRNEAIREAMFSFLRALGLEPLEWSRLVQSTGGGVPYVGQVLKTAFEQPQAVVVLQTPDDLAYLQPRLHGPNEPVHEREPTGQARPNVLFESGMAMGLFPDRTILVNVGNVRPYSDIAGRHVIHVSNSQEWRNDLAERLRSCHCPVDKTGTDWLNAGDSCINPDGNGGGLPNHSLLDTLHRSGLHAAFRIQVQNPIRDERVEALVTEELDTRTRSRFRLSASSGASYLNRHGKVWQGELGKAITDNKADLMVVLESPFSQFAKTRALANGVRQHHWDEKISPSRLRELQKRENVEIRVTDHSVNCSLFFTSHSVFYDPYLWARRSDDTPTENNFWVLEFRNQHEPDHNYECYALLERHFRFLYSSGMKVTKILGKENSKRYQNQTQEFVKAIRELSQEKSGDPGV